MIKRLISLLVSVLLLTAQVSAGILINSYSVVPSGPCVPPTLTFIGTVTATANSDPTTFTGAAIGTASADRLVVVAATVGDSSSTSFTSVTIAGNAMTQVAASAVTLGAAGVFAFNQTTGTTANIVVDLANSPLNVAIHVYTLTGLQSFTAVDSDTSSASDPSVTVTVPDCGVVIAGAVSNANTTTTWVGAVEDNDTALETSHTHSAASKSVSPADGAFVVTADFVTNTSPNLAVGVFQ